MTDKHHSSWLDNVGGIIALCVIGIYGFTVIMPYWLPPVTNPDMIALLDRSKGTVDTVTVAVIMFYFGGTIGRRLTEQVMEKQASTIQAVQAAKDPSPKVDAEITLKGALSEAIPSEVDPKP